MSNVANLDGQIALSTLNLQTRGLGPDSAAVQSGEKAKIDKAARDFESILLGQWLQKAEQSFCKILGDEEGSDDGGGEQMQGLSIQQLSQFLAKSGGIGIAKMITRQLERTEATRQSTVGLGPEAGSEHPGVTK